MADFRKVAVAVAVAILFAFFVGLLLDLVYEAPKYETFCKPDDFFRAKPLIAPASAVPEEQCIYGEEYQQCLKKGGTPELNYTNATCPSFESCNLCNLEFNEASKQYNRNIFIIVGIIGLLAIFFGVLWKIEFLGTGFMFGGILLLVYGTARFFGDADKLLRVIIIFAELLIVIWVGYVKLYRKERKKV